METLTSAFSNLLEKGTVLLSPRGSQMDLSLPLTQVQSDTERSEFRIEGMTCGSCVEAVESALRDQEGIVSITVALLAERGIVLYEPTKWNPEKIAAVIEDLGFDATHIPATVEDSVTLKVYGMTCSSCTSTVESSVSSLPGVRSVALSLAAETCRVAFDRSMVGPRDMIACIEDLGFDAILTADESDATQLESLARTKEIHAWRRQFLLSAAFAIPVFILSMILPMMPFARPFTKFCLFPGIYLTDMICLILTIPVQFWLGAGFFRSAWKSVKHGSATMDVLVVVGTMAAFSYSSLGMLAAPFVASATGEEAYRPSTFFDTSTMLITFVSMGRYMENMAKGKTSAALTDLMKLTPSMATIYTDAECTQEKKIGTDLVQVGDTLKVVPGDKVPADGSVLRGSSSVDESAVTGEPIPVLKQVGDSVIGGTLNGLGAFDMLVTRAGKDTALSQIVNLVNEAQTSKAPIQAFTDRVAGYFVPFVLTTALLTFTVWLIISHALAPDSLPAMFHSGGASKFSVCLKLCISVVVVACPCALGLSTPTAIMVGTGVGAQNGILIKGGAALEASRTIKKIVLDKTGTVTEGKLSVASVAWVSADEQSPRNVSAAESLAGKGLSSLDVPSADRRTLRTEVLALMASAEARSEHPLARAAAAYGHDILARITAIGGTPIAEVTRFESIPGAGIRAQLSLESPHRANHSASSYEVVIGSASFLQGDEFEKSPTEKSTFSSHLLDFEAQESDLGRTVVFVGLVSSGGPSVAAGQIIPVLALSLADNPKPSSRQAIKGLQAMGIDVCLLTGDSAATAQAVAKLVGIPPELVWSRVSPKGKAKIISDLMSQNEGGVAMVGDGINDSPALVAADLGIALSSGTSIAVEAASIILMRSDLLDVIAALSLSRSIYATIRRNLVWACMYNLLGLPLAMGIFLPWGWHLHPMTAAAAMAFSSVSVVTSSLMLRWWVRPSESVLDGLPKPKPRNISKIIVETGRSVVRESRDIASRWFTPRSTAGYDQVPMEAV